MNIEESWKQFYELISKQFPYLNSGQDQISSNMFLSRSEQQYKKLSIELLKQIQSNFKPFSQRFSLLIVMDQANQYYKNLALYYNLILKLFSTKNLRTVKQKNQFLVKFQEGNYSKQQQNQYLLFKKLLRLSQKIKLFSQTLPHNRYVFSDKAEPGIFKLVNSENSFVFHNFVDLQLFVKIYSSKMDISQSRERHQNQCYSMVSFLIQEKFRQIVGSSEIGGYQLDLIIKKLKIDEKLKQIKESSSKFPGFKDNINFLVIAEAMHQQYFIKFAKFHKKLTIIQSSVEDISKLKQLQSQFDQLIVSFLNKINNHAQTQTLDRRFYKKVKQAKQILQPKQKFKQALAIIATYSKIEFMPINIYEQRLDDQYYFGQFSQARLTGVVSGEFQGQILNITSPSLINKKEKRQYYQINKDNKWKQIKKPKFPFTGKLIGTLQGTFNGALNGKFKGTFIGKFKSHEAIEQFKRKEWFLTNNQIFFIAKHMKTSFLDSENLTYQTIKDNFWLEKFKLLADSNICQFVYGRFKIKKSKEDLSIINKQLYQQNFDEIDYLYQSVLPDTEDNFAKLFDRQFTQAISSLPGTLTIQDFEVNFNPNLKVIQQHRGFYKNFFSSFDRQNVQDPKKLQQKNYKNRLFEQHLKQFYEQVKTKDKNQGIGAKPSSKQQLGNNTYFDSLIFMKDSNGQYLLVTIDFTLDVSNETLFDKLNKMVQFYDLYIKDNFFLGSKLQFKHYIVAPDSLVHKIYRGTKLPRENSDRPDIKEEIRCILSSNPHFIIAPISKIKFTSKSHQFDGLLRWVNAIQKYIPTYLKNMSQKDDLET